MPWSGCCALATKGRPAKAATADIVRILIKPARVRAMWIFPPKNASRQPCRPASLVCCLAPPDRRRTSESGHDTHERVFAATGAGGSGVFLYARDSDLEYFNSARPQRAMQGNEQVIGGEKPHHARERGSARRGGPERVPGRRGCEPTQHQHTRQHSEVDAASAGERDPLSPAPVVHARAQPHHSHDEREGDRADRTGGEHEGARKAPGWRCR